MPPKESDRLLNQKHDDDAATHPHHAPPLFLSMRSSSTLMEEGGFSENKKKGRFYCLRRGGSCYLTVAMVAIAATLGVFASRAFLKNFGDGGRGNQQQQARTGPYQLTELQVGKKLFDFYEFYEGADSLGSAGFNTYTAEKRALALGLLNVTQEHGGDEFVYLNTRPTEQGPRESVRLEGRRRFDAGLFLLDIDHMPAGCGQWPAFWLTDEDYWPDHGEIDIVEGVNYQTQAKTALHTSDRCSMYAHVADYSFSGHWDRATGIPDSFTGAMDTQTSVPADNCWNLAPHQWANQGCVAVSAANDTLGPGLNREGGGVYALQWDPTTHAIRSWVFPKSGGIPRNLQESMDTASNDDGRVTPDPDSWGLPYAAFAIGDTTGCSADHFQNMRIVLNTAFCGTVAGNRFFRDCPVQAQQFNVSNDPVLSCNAWIQSRPKELEEAYWKIRGVYVYERAFETQSDAADEEDERSQTSN